LALISSGMQNCNAKRDGKCLRYRKTWAEHTRNSTTFIASLREKLAEIKKDIESEILHCRPTIINGDVRRELQRLTEDQKFKLCVTSPPYLNTFDYTDIYRPELFLGHFVNNTDELYKLRLRAVRSHLQAKWQNPKKSDFGSLYEAAIEHVKSNVNELMDKRIPLMIQAYFEDMAKILSDLKDRARDGAQAWLVVSNSAYADREIPVDLIIADIGANLGWKLKEVAVLENIKRRKTKYSPSIDTLRESLIIFENAK
jgi:prefoldin subunit 5